MKNVKKYSKFIQPIRGTHDILPYEHKKHQKILNTGYGIASTYNFKPISTPILENEKVFKTTLGEQSDVISKEMYTFQKSKENLCLRPENTAGIVRSLISNSLYFQLPQKFCYDGPMFRYERPQKGRFRQFHQFGVECFGSHHPLSDLQIIQMADEFLKELKIEKKLEINSLGIFLKKVNFPP
jgi:histidyl-tRNA synthetase